MNADLVVILLVIFLVWITWAIVDSNKSNKKSHTDASYVKDLELRNWDWPYLRTNFNRAKEYACPHGVGHGGIHCCDGCCSHESYKRRLKEK